MYFKSYLLGSLLAALCAQIAESCNDHPAFTWTLLKDNQTVVGCSWLTKNSIKMAARKTKYCDGNTQIRAACAVSCDNCTSAPTNAPTKSLTKPPTQAPTDLPTKAPTKVPTKIPTSAPTGPCADSTTHSGQIVSIHLSTTHGSQRIRRMQA